MTSQYQDDLLKSIVEVSILVASPVLESIVNALKTLPAHASHADRLAISDLAPHPSSRDALRQLLALWTDSSPAISPDSLAWALKSASAMNDHQRSTQSLELVWTGPAHPSMHFRRTDQALYEIINEAKRSILIATYAAYKTPDLDRALLTAAARGVHITMIVESSEIAEGKMKFGAFEGLRKSLLDKVSIFVWPLEKREKDERGNFGTLHAKCAIGDERMALISSANLTGFALSLNMELGIFIHGGQIPRAISDQLNQLIADKTLTPAMDS